MYGLVLCGGESSRMGNDKGLLLQDGKHWVQIAADKLSILQVPVKVSVNKRQQDVYEKKFAAHDLIVDDEQLLIKGPLLGMLSCHLAFPNEDLFVLACDILNMETHLLESLYKKYREQNSDAYIFVNGGDAEPLCGIYTAKALTFVLDMYKRKRLYKQSMKFALSLINTCRIELPDNEKKCFQNFNSPRELL